MKHKPPPEAALGDRARLKKLLEETEAQVAREVGRELRAYDLQPRTIVVTNPEHRPGMFLTMWVTDITDSMVWLLAAASEPAIHLGLFRQADGTLKDDAGRAIRIFEYLGKE